MLPRSIYELIPYIYLSVGAVGCAIFESELILIASVIVIIAGFIILWMRIDYRRTVFDGVAESTGRVNRSGQDRRQDDSSAFPLVDRYGVVVNRDRRTGDRRSLAA